jgi:FixJ family two-component response regulator
MGASGARWDMKKRAIMIADRDADYRNQMADHFRLAGYQVETTESTAHVLCSILEKQTPVLLLGNDFDNKIPSADLIRLLKKCNRHLHVIIVSEDMPLKQARMVRHEGIFYHALKPAAQDDTAELGLAVDCAFKKSLTDRQVTVAEPAVEVAPQCEEIFQKSEPEKSQPVLPALVALVSLILGASFLSLVAAERAGQGDSLTLMLFLALCALIIVTQLLPIFQIRLPFGSRRWRGKEEHSPLDPK